MRYLASILLTLLSIIATSLTAQPLVLPEYPSDRLESILNSRTQAEGPIFRAFLAEVVYACALARTDSSQTPASVEALKTILSRYPDLIRWLNGGLPSAIAAAELQPLMGDGLALQAQVDAYVESHIDLAGLRPVVADSENEGLLALDVAIPEDLALLQDPRIRDIALGILERLYTNLDLGRRRACIDAAFGDSLFTGIIGAVNARLSNAVNAGKENSLDFGQMVDLGSITAGMPPEYAELLDFLLPLYYSRFRDRHRLAIHYLLAEPDRRMAAMFHASGPGLQKLFQMIADYTNNTKVRGQLNELKSGIRAYGERDIKPIVDAALRSSVSPEMAVRIQVDYDALGAGTIGQAHMATLDPGTPQARRFIIKVKRPGLQDAIDREMALFDEIAESAFAKKLVRDVRATLELEMDLGREARQIIEAGRVYKHPRITVARVVDFINPTADIVAIDFVDARTLDRVNDKLDEVSLQIGQRHGVNRPIAEHYMANLLAAQADALNELIQLWFEEALFGSGFFHGDLHSGNVFMVLDEVEKPFEERFLGRHRLVLIDFGNTGSFTHAQQQGVIEFMAAVARKDLDATLAGLAKTGTTREEDSDALRDTVAAILRGSDLNYIKTDRIATVGYAEGTADTRDLLSFVRARTLLETQLNDVNRRLDLVDPGYRYPRHTAWDAYPVVIKKHVIGHCLLSLIGMGGKGDRIISCSEARVLYKASKHDFEVLIEEGEIPVYPKPQYRPARMVVGLRGGLSRASVSDINDAQARWTWHLSLTQHYAVGPKTYFQPELGYAAAGYNRPGSGFRESNRIHTVALPLLLGRRIVSGLASIYAGPQISLLVSGSGLIYEDGGTTSTLDLDNNLETIELAAVAGITLGLPKGFGLDIRYALGLSDISKSGSDLKTRSLQLSLTSSLARIGRLIVKKQKSP